MEMQIVRVETETLVTLVTLTVTRIIMMNGPIYVTHRRHRGREARAGATTEGMRSGVSMPAARGDGVASGSGSGGAALADSRPATATAGAGDPAPSALSSGGDAADSVPGGDVPGQPTTRNTTQQPDA